jgi:hypothetical protein
MRSPIKLEFSEKYDKDHAREYFLKHQDGLARRLSHKRDEQLARRALAWLASLAWYWTCRAVPAASGRCWRKSPTG